MRCLLCGVLSSAGGLVRWKQRQFQRAERAEGFQADTSSVWEVHRLSFSPAEVVGDSLRARESDARSEFVRDVDV